MTDERDRTGKRPKIMGDGERARIGKQRRTPPYGTPFVDEEATQPPGPPPGPSQLADLPIEERVTVLHETVERLSAGVERVWPARNADEQFGRLQLAVSSLVKESTETTTLLREYLMPWTKSIAARLDGIERTVSSESGRQERFYEHDWPRLVDSLEKIDRRVDLVERQCDRIERAQDAAAKRVDDGHSGLRAELEDQKRGREKDQLRIRALEDALTGIKAKVAAVSLLVGGGGAGGAVAIWKLFFS